MTTAPNPTRGRTRLRLIVLLPLIAFLALAALFLYRLGSGDPSRIPSALIGRPVPATDLPPLDGLTRDGKPVPGLASADFNGAVTLVNVWARGLAVIWGRFCLDASTEDGRRFTLTTVAPAATR